MAGSSEAGGNRGREAGGLGGSVAGLECQTLALWLPTYVRVWEKVSGGVQRSRMTQRQGDKVEERQIFNEAHLQSGKEAGVRGGSI